MFKIGDKAKGFKFEVGTDGVGYDSEMDDYVEEIGVVVDVYTDSFVVQFPDSLEWMYPASLAHLAKIEEKIPLKKGDRVKFTESSLASGMIDAKEDDVFIVKESYKRAVTLKELEGCYHVTHFEHVQEEVMNSTEEKEIDWQVGQEVFCLLRGKGVVVRAGDNDGAPYVVGVDFGYTFDNYTIDGKIYDDHKGRVLFFSEPKIEAEKFPPKKPFVATLKKGDLVVVETDLTTSIQEVVKETEDVLYTLLTDYNKKEINLVFKLSEEVKFK